MEFKELVKTRRSIRKYGGSAVSADEIREIISTAQLAPSWKNTQCGRYYVALSEEKIAQVRQCLPDFNQNSTVNAAYIISTFVQSESGSIGKGEMSPEGELWGSYDLGLQNAYLLLKAADLGYDTLVMGLRDTDRLKELFQIPDNETIMPVIAIGKRDGEAIFRPRKDLEEIVKIF